MTGEMIEVWLLKHHLTGLTIVLTETINQVRHFVVLLVQVEHVAVKMFNFLTLCFVEFDSDFFM